MKNVIYAFAFVLFLAACQSPKPTADGMWRAEVPTIIGAIPFNLEIETINDTMHVFAINGKEKLELDNAYFENDSLHITMEVFDAVITAKVSDGKMRGIYKKKLGSLRERSGVFTATLGQSFRFAENSESAPHDVSGKWATVFTDDEGESYPAIGLFEQTGNVINGTFLTNTGDYRFLSGNVLGDSLMLSCFDGTHIYLFKAEINGDKLMGGKNSSSMYYQETWEAVKDDNAELANPETLTYVKEGYDETLNFSFLNTSGEMISLSDERYEGKVVLVQILGSWCPNCMDESKFYGKWLANNKERGVEIIGLAFEKSVEHDFAFPKIDRMKKRFGMDYEVLLAGLNIKEEADKVLPMLNHVMSFPTTLYLDRNHKIRKIHTGFSGPGTGEYYERFVDGFERYLDLLITEETNI